MRDSLETRTWLGERVRQLRKHRGQTLRDLSARTGMSISTLSKIETAKLSATFDGLLALARGLETGIDTLLSPSDLNGPSGRRTYTKRGEGDQYETRQYAYELLCTDLARKQMLPIVAELKADSPQSFGPRLAHAGEEFAYVLEGEAVLLSDFYEPLPLKKGDCVYFDSVMGHAFVKAGKARTLLLWVCSAATADLINQISAMTAKRGNANGARRRARAPAPRPKKNVSD